MQLKGKQAVNLGVVEKRDLPSAKEEMVQLAPLLEISFKRRRPRKRDALTRKKF